MDLSELYISRSKSRASSEGMTNIRHERADVLEFLRSQPAGSMDVIGIFGNSIIYPEPQLTRSILKESARVLRAGSGVFLTDFVDLEHYAPRLANRPVSSMFTSDPRDTQTRYERLVMRKIHQIDDPAFVRLQNLGIYVRNGRQETTHDDGSLYLPTMPGFLDALKDAGFQQVEAQPFEADYPLLNMMRNRIAIRASV